MKRKIGIFKMLATAMVAVVMTAAAVQAAAPVIDWHNIPNSAEVGVNYQWEIEAYGTDVIWSIASGRLPDGLSIYETYDWWSDYSYTYIYGTPTETGPFTFEVAATNGDGSGTREFTITINELQPPVITTTTLSNGEVGASYSSQIRADGSGITWSIPSGSSLPPGLQLGSTSQGQGYVYRYISGTPTQAGPFTFKVAATNAAGSDTATFTINIDEQQPPVITTTSLSNGEKDVYYNSWISATGGGITWSIASGNLPDGLSIDPNGNSWSGQSETYIYGTPTETGSFTFEVAATNATESDTTEYTIVITELQLPVITTTSLPVGIMNVSYNNGYIRANGTGITWSIPSSSSLPPGLSIYENYSSSTDEFGQRYSYTYVYGTPTTVDTFTFKVAATNAAGSDTSEFTIVVEPPLSAPITNIDLPRNGAVGVSYSGNIRADGSNVTWSVESGELPDGLSWYRNQYPTYSYMQISGTPTKADTYTFTVQADNGTDVGMREFTVVIGPRPLPVISTTSLSNGEVGAQRNWQIGANVSGITWSIDGDLPPGLQLNADYDGNSYTYISGTPADTGTFTFTVVATNETGSGTKELTLKIIPLQPPVITATSLPNGQNGMSYNYYSNIASGSNVTLSTESGTFPPGLYYSGSNIYGTPTETGTFTFTVKAENDAGSVTKQFTIVIAPPPAPSITSRNVPAAGSVGSTFSGTFSANVVGITWELDGDVPPWLQLDETYNNYNGNRNLRIYGTPTQSGPYTFTVTATNETGSSAPEEFTVVIDPPPSAPSYYTASVPSSGQAGGYYYGTVYMRYATTWSIVDGPAWLEVEESGWNTSYGQGMGYARIGGTPDATGPVTFTVKAENEIGEVTRDFTVNIGELQPPSISTSSIPNSGEKTVNYSASIQASGYSITWSIDDGELPPGLELVDQSNGQGNSNIYVRGIPTAAGSYTFTVKADNGAGDGNTKQYTINITELQPPVITTETLPNGEKGVSYNSQVYVEGSNMTLSIIGSLPPGLNSYTNSYTGYSYRYIYGTPTTIGTYTFKVVAKNDAGSDTTEYTIAITELLPPVITTTVLPDGVVGSSYGNEIRATGSNITLSLEGELPPGLSYYINSGTGWRSLYINGTPTQTGTFTFKAVATNDAGSDTTEFAIVIRNIEIITIALPAGEINADYEARIETRSGSSINWNISSGNFPPSLNTSSYWDWQNGRQVYFWRIYGTPTQAGTYNFTVRAYNGTSSDEKRLSIEIYAPYTVTFDANGGNAIDPATGTTGAGGKLASLPTPTRTGYTFDGWFTGETDGDEVTTSTAFRRNTTIYAQWTINTYTVTFVDQDGMELDEQTVDYGSAATAPTTDPTRTGYTFTGWDEEFDNVTGDLTVKAQYAINTYTVTFVDHDGTELDEQTVDYGSTATAPTSPTRTGHTFTDWDKEFDNVTEDLEVKAQYAINTYTVTFVDHDGTELYEQTVDYGNAATAPTTDPIRTGYTFTDWDKEFDNVTGDLEVKAQYAINTYIVTFVDHDGTTVLLSQQVNYGSAAVAPITNPTRTGYSFTGWDKEFSTVTEDLEITAEYTLNVYTVIFVDYDGTTELDRQTVNHGGTATAPTSPTRTGYTFSRWDRTLTNVTKDLEVRAEYVFNVYTVTFVDYDSTTVLLSQQVNHGGGAIAPASPTRTGYTFAGWDKEFSTVTEDLEVVAVYTLNVYTVTFVDHDGTALSQQTVNHGSAATAPASPTRTGYAFTGWDVDFSAVTGDLTVTAMYDVTPILPKIATGNLLTQTRSGLNLTAKTNATIEVYNLSGKLISRQNYIAGNYSISFGHLPKGMYIVKASFGSEKQTLRMPVR